MMWQIIKWAITASIVVAISLVSKKYTFFGSLLAALPLISVLALIWMYVEGQDIETINQFSRGVFWMVLPSLPMFLLLPKLIEKLDFPLAILSACAITTLLYFIMVKVLTTLKIDI
ncbi:DUF3147 family protein [bacterium]|nr:DUF3147 family protein [bacterium]